MNKAILSKNVDYGYPFDSGDFKEYTKFIIRVVLTSVHSLCFRTKKEKECIPLSISYTWLFDRI